MDQIRLFLAIAAATIHGVAFFLYCRQMKVGESRPNVVTWSITSFLMLLNALTFHQMVKDPVAVFQFFIGATGCVIICLYALVGGKFSRPGPSGGWSLLLGIIAALVWYMFRDGAWANMIVLFALFVALIPTWEGTYHNPFLEMPRSWAMWATAYLITSVNLLLGPDVQAMSLVNPVSAIFAHGVVAVLSTKGRKKKFALLHIEA